MDDFELGLSSRVSYKDEFYESFQAPKFYDFINPHDSVNADEWFFKDVVKEVSVKTTVETITSTSLEVKKSVKGSVLKSKLLLEENDNSAENEDPNHKPEAGEKNGRKPEQKPPGEQSPGKASRRLKISQAAPATVPQKKILATRKAALEIKRQPAASKSLLETFKRQVQSIQTSKAPGALRAEGGIKEKEIAPKNYSSEFEESCKRSDDEAPACRRAIGQEVDVSGGDRDSAAAVYVVEQATMLESAIKLLNLGDDAKNVKVCSEIMGAVCADEATTQQRKEVAGEKQVFSFTAMRAENPSQRKRKSKELKVRVSRKDNCTRKHVMASTSPPASVSSARPVATLKRPRITCPQPFRLRTQERGAVKEIEFNKKMKHYIALKEGLVEFPTFASQPVSKAAEIPIKKKFHFQRAERLQARADNRSPVEVSIEMVTKDLAKQQIDSESDAPRKQTRPLGVPSFSKPFRPQRSTKKLTVPVEPKFHAIHARRTCTRHNNGAAQ